MLVSAIFSQLALVWKDKADVVYQALLGKPPSYGEGRYLDKSQEQVLIGLVTERLRDDDQTGSKYSNRFLYSSIV